MFVFCALIHILGIIFIIFFIEEVPQPKSDLPVDGPPANSTPKTGVDNFAYDTTESSGNIRTRNVAKVLPEVSIECTIPEKKSNIFKESIEVFISNFKILSVVRAFSGRTILWMVLFGYSIFAFSNSKKRYPKMYISNLKYFIVFQSTLYW